MTDRIDAYVAGAVEWAALTPDERVAANLTVRAIRDTRAFIDARPTPDLSARVMNQVEGVRVRPATRRQPAWRRCMDGLWTAHHVSLQLRPAYAVLAAVVLMAAVTFIPRGWRSSPDGASSLVSAPTGTKLLVRFRLETSEASTVRLAGSFSNWQPTYELRELAPGVWTLTLPLSPGVHDYAFVVDGKRWIADPYAPAVDDGFGGTNSRLALVPPEDPRL